MLYVFIGLFVEVVSYEFLVILVLPIGNALLCQPREFPRLLLQRKSQQYKQQATRPPKALLS